MPAKSANSEQVSSLLYILLIFTLMLLSTLNIYSYVTQKPALIVVNTEKDDIVFWENIQKQNPTYRDAYLVLSKIKEQEGDVLSAQDFKDEALKIDPFIPQTSLQ